MAEENKVFKKPLPEITPVNKPFWDGAKAGKLMMQKCQDCGTWVFCPRPVCGDCASDRLDWVQVGGKGKIFCFTVVREVVGQALRGFAPDIPYVTAWVDLDEGPRFCSNIIGYLIETAYFHSECNWPSQSRFDTHGNCSTRCCFVFVSTVFWL